MKDERFSWARTAPVLPDVIEEHLMELMFLGLQRRKLLFSPETNLFRYRRHDERIAAQLDGLRLGGALSQELCAAQLCDDDPWAVFAAALALIESAAVGPLELAEAVEVASDEQLGGWREALRCSSDARLQEVLPFDSVAGLAPRLRALGFDAWAWRGRLPAAELLGSLTAGEQPEVRRAVARGLASQVELAAGALETLGYLVGDPDPSVRRVARFGLARHDSAAARCWCREAGAAGDPFGIRLLGVVGELPDLDLLLPHLGTPRLAVVAMQAIGELGNVAGVTPLIESFMRDPEKLEFAEAALLTLLGRVPLAEDPEGELSHYEQAAMGWHQQAGEFAEATRWYAGLPNSGPSTITQEEPFMGQLWRRALGGDAELAWLGREVPDGFFADEASLEAIPGE